MPGLLALLAHPDDEFFCGGLLAALAAREVPVHLAYWTRGEGGGSPRSRRFWGCFPVAWRPRTREAHRAASLLGASSLTFLGAVDPAPDPQPRAPEEGDFRETFAQLLSRQAPEMIVTHGSDGDYGHPAHRRLSQLARECAACPVISFNAAWPGGPQARFINANDPADFVLDAGPYLEKKRALVLAHRSQKGVLESLAGGTLYDLLRLARQEGYRCWNEKESALEKLGRWTEGTAV